MIELTKLQRRFMDTISASSIPLSTLDLRYPDISDKYPQTIVRQIKNKGLIYISKWIRVKHNYVAHYSAGNLPDMERPKLDLPVKEQKRIRNATYRAELRGETPKKSKTRQLPKTVFAYGYWGLL